MERALCARAIRGVVVTLVLSTAGVTGGTAAGRETNGTRLYETAKGCVCEPVIWTVLGGSGIWGPIRFEV